MLCDKCLRYHSLQEFCQKTRIKCQSCGHEQYTYKKDIQHRKCGVCNKYKMRIK